MPKNYSEMKRKVHWVASIGPPTFTTLLNQYYNDYYKHDSGLLKWQPYKHRSLTYKILPVAALLESIQCTIK